MRLSAPTQAALATKVGLRPRHERCRTPSPCLARAKACAAAAQFVAIDDERRGAARRRVERRDDHIGSQAVFGESRVVQHQRNAAAIGQNADAADAVTGARVDGLTRVAPIGVGAKPLLDRELARPPANDRQRAVRPAHGDGTAIAISKDGPFIVS